jgi:hypothetical protein
LSWSWLLDEQHLLQLLLLLKILIVNFVIVNFLLLL